MIVGKKEKGSCSSAALREKEKEEAGNPDLRIFWSLSKFEKKGRIQVLEPSSSFDRKKATGIPHYFELAVGLNWGGVDGHIFGGKRQGRGFDAGTPRSPGRKLHLPSTGRKGLSSRFHERGRGRPGNDLINFSLAGSLIREKERWEEPFLVSDAASS